jgi:putative ABC transport system substrate-binding protein
MLPFRSSRAVIPSLPRHSTLKYPKDRCEVPLRRSFYLMSVLPLADIPLSAELTNSSASLTAKRLELLRDLVPGAHKVAYLWAPESPMTTARGEQARTAARALGIELVPLPIMSNADLPVAFELAEKERVKAVLVESDALMVRICNNVIDECLVRDLPAMHAWPFEVRTGALISYGPANSDNYPGAANYVDRILRGAKVADLPFQEPTQIKLAINQRTARSIKITVPPSLLARADEVIE